VTRIFISVILVVAGSIASVSAADDAQLAAAFHQMMAPEIDQGNAHVMARTEIDQHDFKLILDTGTFYFFTPITLDSRPRLYGGMFFGKGHLQFRPPVSMERQQLNRFFKSDSLNRSITTAMILCDSALASRLSQLPSLEVDKIQRPVTEAFDDCRDFLTMREEYAYLFAALRNLVAPRKQGYLLVNTKFENDPQVFYIFDPYEREEVQLLRQYKEFVVAKYMETICSYSIYADESYTMINGMDKDAITPEKYTVDATIEGDNNFSAVTTAQISVQITPTQLLDLVLHERLKVDSIRDASGRSLPFLRYTNRDNRSTELCVFLAHPAVSGDTVRLTFYYEGDIITRPVGDYWVAAGSDWYPRFNFYTPTALDMTFHTPSAYTFVASGRMESSRVAGDTLVTHWVTREPVRYASFNIGNFKKSVFGGTNGPQVEIYYLEQLHRDSAQKLLDAVRYDTTLHFDVNYGFDSWDTPSITPWSGDVEERLAGDLIGAIQLYSKWFGRPPHDTMVASEALGQNFAGVSYPGFVQLDFAFSHRSDPYGLDKMVRAHEVAHEWWAQSIGTETYHDGWLSEGFAMYSSMMYLQATMGNKQFEYWLNEYRKQVMSLNKFLLKDRNEAGPIALGRRTLSSKTYRENDYNLIVYEKGALVLHMLRYLLMDLTTGNEDRFMDMMKDYYATFKGKNVNTQEFKQIVEKHFGEDMTWFFDQWVFESAVPTYDFDYKFKPRADKGYDITFTIKQKDVPDSFKMYVPVEIEAESGQHTYIRALVDKPIVTDTVAVLGRPKKVRLNPFLAVLANVNQ